MLANMMALLETTAPPQNCFLLQRCVAAWHAAVNAISVVPGLAQHGASAGVAIPLLAALLGDEAVGAWRTLSFCWCEDLDCGVIPAVCSAWGDHGGHLMATSLEHQLEDDVEYGASLREKQHLHFCVHHCGRWCGPW